MKGLKSYFKRLKPTPPEENVIDVEVQPQSPPQDSQGASVLDKPQGQSPIHENQNEVDITNFESDPGKRIPIHLMTKNPIERENIRRRARFDEWETTY
ncbi:unnamed protein product [Cuscuta campestris]|uniref:Uncharacterized protein n=1 Tax=Cuscuta campestris TaxID=132261 RepID=A0A484N800_9ASTE|nr:unnamed protein product [Cuscuta campestris]